MDDDWVYKEEEAETDISKQIYKNREREREMMIYLICTEKTGSSKKKKEKNGDWKKKIFFLEKKTKSKENFLRSNLQKSTSKTEKIFVIPSFTSSKCP